MCNKLLHLGREVFEEQVYVRDSLLAMKRSVFCLCNLSVQVMKKTLTIAAAGRFTCAFFVLIVADSSLSFTNGLKVQVSHSCNSLLGVLNLLDAVAASGRDKMRSASLLVECKPQWFVNIFLYVFNEFE